MKIKLSIVVSALVALNFANFAAAAESRLVSFGLITDTHVSDKADQATTLSVNASARYFTGGKAKIEAFAKAMNKANVAFVAELGDFTDNPANGSLPFAERKAAALAFVDAAEASFALFKGPRYHVFGNHDTDQMSKQDYLKRLTNSGIAPGATYYSFNQGGVHFVVLDAGFKANGADYSGVPSDPGAAYNWADANIPAAEIDWLKADLQANKLPVIVLGHQYLNPAEQVDPLFDPAHSVKNAAEVRSLLENNAQVLAVFAGHYHDGGYQRVNGIDYVGLQGNVAYGNDASYHNQYVTVDVRADGKAYQLAVAGNGLQKSYVINKVLP